MNVAVCFNRVPPKLAKGEAADRLSEEGAEKEALAVAEALKELGFGSRLIPLGNQVGTFIEELEKTRPEEFSTSARASGAKAARRCTSRP